MDMVADRESVGVRVLGGTTERDSVYDAGCDSDRVPIDSVWDSGADRDTEDSGLDVESVADASGESEGVPDRRVTVSASESVWDLSAVRESDCVTVSSSDAVREALGVSDAVGRGVLVMFRYVFVNVGTRDREAVPSDIDIVASSESLALMESDAEGEKDMVMSSDELLEIEPNVRDCVRDTVPSSESEKVLVRIFGAGAGVACATSGPSSNPSATTITNVHRNRIGRPVVRDEPPRIGGTNVHIRYCCCCC
jgi:hypothetical protein